MQDENETLSASSLDNEVLFLWDVEKKQRPMQYKH